MRTAEFVNPYPVLGVPSSATAAEIKAAFRAIALETHPDRGGDAASFARAREAYEALKDPSARARTDALILAEQEPQSAPNHASMQNSNAGFTQATPSASRPAPASKWEASKPTLVVPEVTRTYLRYLALGVAGAAMATTAIAAGLFVLLGLNLGSLTFSGASWFFVSGLAVVLFTHLIAAVPKLRYISASVMVAVQLVSPFLLSSLYLIGAAVVVVGAYSAFVTWSQSRSLR